MSKQVQQWEYKADSAGDFSTSVKTLNELGAEGWELVALLPLSGMLFRWFKRPVQRRGDES